ncbi:MAG: hypothetical protein AB1938_15675 [Myxococcota bacterium]
MKVYRLGWLTIRGGAGVMAVLAVVGTLAIGLAHEFTLNHLTLTPDLVIRRLELWQALTWLFIPLPSPLSVIIGILLILSLGGALEENRGTLGLWRLVLGIGVTTAFLTVLLSLLVPKLAGAVFTGLEVVTLILWVGYGLWFKRSIIRFWSLPITGYTFAALGLAFSLLSGLFGSWVRIIPDLIAAGLTYLVVVQGFPGDVWTRLRSWQLNRELKKRSAHLRSLDGGRGGGDRGSDKYLH